MPELGDIIDSSLVLTGGNVLQRAALTGDVTAAAGSNVTTVAGLTTVGADIDAVEADVATLQTDVDAVEADVVTLQTDLDTAEAALAAVQAADVIVETATAAFSAEKVLGTTVITISSVLLRQAAEKAGRIHLPTDGFSLSRDTGAAWQPWGPLFPLTEPVSGDFAWINQGGASVSTVKGGIFLRAPTSATVDLRLRKKTAPATPYTVTAAFLFALLNVNYQYGGLVFREASSGTLETFGVSCAAIGMQLNVDRFTDESTYDTSPLTIPYGLAGGQITWLRISDDGANRNFYYSADGQNWLTLLSHGNTSYITADEIGFFVGNQSSTYEAGATLLSWLQS